MDLFARLRYLARTQTEAIALEWPERRVTSRRLWSRIERACARLQAQWEIAPGERIAYYGPAHPDALLLYLAAARCGATLVPLERPALQENAGQLARALGIRLMLCQEDHPLPADARGLLLKPLSELIGQPCPREPWSIIEDPAHPGLEIVELPLETVPRTRRIGLSDLMPPSPPLPQGGAAVVETGLFEAATLGPVVLAALWAGVPLAFPRAAARPR
ncbi:MAG: AMP-binding protein [Noviherbaspirillum sp.]